MNRLLAAVAATVLAVGTQAAAAAWPEKPINVVLGFAPGGGLDQTLLPLKPLMERRLGQPFLLNYKPGAGGRIGFEFVHLNGADGYTIGALSEPHFSNTVVFEKPRYKVEDMVPLGLIMRDVPIWFVRKDSPFKDMNDLIAEARRRPGQIRVAIGSFTGEHYVSMALVEELAGVKFRPVNVQGGAPVMTNVVGGHFEVGISRPGSITGIKDEIRGLGLVASKRSALFPETPTFDEQLPANIRIPHLSSARGLMVTARFARDNPDGFRRLETAFREAVNSPEFKEHMDRQGLELDWTDGPATAKELQESVKLYTQYKDLVDAAKNR